MRSRKPLLVPFVSCFALLVALLAPSPVLAATLHGTVYDANLVVATDVVVTIDTQPLQRLLSTDGDYAFDVPPGNYTLAAVALRDGTNTTVTEYVVVTQEGSFSYDLFLFPSLDEDETLYDEASTDLADPPAVPASPTGAGPWPVIIFTLLVLLLLLIPILWLRRHFRKLSSEPPPVSGQDEQLDQAIAALQAEGGRMTQKELRKRLPYGEAKVSLLVAELEAKGRVEKLKKGRGNIIVLRK